MQFGDFFKQYKITPRPQQQDVLNSLNENWEKYKYFILSLPTGVGKTFLSCDIANVSGPAYILTSTLQLQEQYEKSWNEIISLKGKSNYTCAVNRNFNCANAPCNVEKSLMSDCISTKKCPYFNRRDAAFASKAFITNPSYFLASSYHGALQNPDECKRKTLIIDEAHVLEQNLVGIGELTLSVSLLAKKLPFVKGLRNIKFSRDVNANITALNEILLILNEHKEQIEKNLEHYTKSQSEGWAKKLAKEVLNHLKERQDELDGLREVLMPLKMFNEDYDTFGLGVIDRWVIDYNSETKEVYIAPLYAGQVFKYIMEPRAEKFVFMSATIGDKTEFCKELGIPLEQTLFVETDTPFPAEKSLIKAIPLLKMGRADIENTMEHIGEVVDQVLMTHEGEKGIIHCSTYKIQERIYCDVEPENRERLLCRDMKVLSEGSKVRLNNEKLLNLHMMSKDNTVLLSPSMNEGVSLDDDLSRFQVITKMPWLSLGNPRIKKKTSLNGDWYANHMWNTIMQAAGRSTRSETDESVTYILDSSFKYFFEQWKNRLPKWFTTRIRFY